MSDLRFLHLANHHSTNIGNGALIFGTERVLREDLGSDIEFIPVPWDDYTFGLKEFDRKFVDLVNDTSDCLLVGGTDLAGCRLALGSARPKGGQMSPSVANPAR